MLLTSGDAHTVVYEQPLDSIRLREGCVSSTINRTLHMHLCGLGFGLPLFFSFVQSNRDGLVGGKKKKKKTSSCLLTRDIYSLDRSPRQSRNR